MARELLSEPSRALETNLHGNFCNSEFGVCDQLLQTEQADVFGE